MERVIPTEMKDLGLLFYLKEVFTLEVFTLLTLLTFLLVLRKFESVTLERPPVPNTLGFLPYSHRVMS